MAVAAAALLAGAGLGACGLRGDLERPGPMWGAKRAEMEAKQRADADARQRGVAAGPNQPSAPLSPEEIADPASSPGTVRNAPLGGLTSDPFGAQQPSGSFPR